MATASLVLGILALVFMFIPFVGAVALPLAIVGIVLGVFARKQALELGNPMGVATAGLVTSVIALIVSGIFTLACGACAAIFSAM